MNTDDYNYIQQRRNYFASRDVHSGWSNRESGPCCDACVLQPKHLNGRADALKLAAGCRNPFQMAEVCQCHVATRRAVTAGIVEAHDQLLQHFKARK